MIKSYRDRHKANREILKRIKKLVDESPDLRFGQILWIMNIVDPRGRDIFNDESTDILNRLTNFE